MNVIVILNVMLKVIFQNVSNLSIKGFLLAA